jgi:hypothetical protein
MLLNSTNGWGEAIQQIKKIIIDYVHGSFDAIFSKHPCLPLDMTARILSISSVVNAVV